ncbi:MAG TPA: beta-N-acetylhexosaminidase [bacterium]|nr:beta-N-acetylhexosaminidase [bacterium]
MKKTAQAMIVGAAMAAAVLTLPARADQTPLPLVPLPVETHRADGRFIMTDSAVIVLPPGAGADWRASAEIFAAKVKQRFGVGLALQAGGPDAGCGPDIALIGSPAACGLKDGLPEAGVPAAEGYQLAAGPDGVVVQARTAHGFHNALMTLLQLIDGKASPPAIPAVKVLDYPRFAWRGMLIDSARSFQPPDVIKKYVDLLSELKLDVLHWHLVDDQGWRIESKVFPRLHEVGGVLAPLSDKKKRALDRDGWGRDGRGYYTQDEIREIVAYAAERHVMVVPEIDVPGHSSAMLAAYPELSCSGDPVPIRGMPGIFRTALCPGKEDVYQFLDTLFTELATLFPAPYLHIGSDEVMASDWLSAPANQELIAKYGYTDNAGLQSYFVGRVNGILRGKGKTMIAWDEITAYAPEGAVIQAWRKQDYARVAAEAGRDAVISPVTHCYIDYPNLTFTLKNLYGFEPLPAGLKPDLAPRILGGEVNLWGERVTLDNMDQKTFPRLIAHAEVMWSPPGERDWNDFIARLKPVKKDMKKRGVGFGKTWRDLFMLL